MSLASYPDCSTPPVADHPLGPATDHRLGKLLPHQLANQTRATLGRIPPFAPQPTGQPFPVVAPLPRAGSCARPLLETPLPVRLACVKHAASVHPEPGSNSP